MSLALANANTLCLKVDIYDEVRDKAGGGSDWVCRTIAATDLRLVASFVSEVVNGFQEDIRSLQ